MLPAPQSLVPGDDTEGVSRFNQCGVEMLTGKQSELNPAQAVENVKARERIHEEQYVQYTHELSYDTKESVGRVIIRLVPLLYGGMFGALLDDMSLALTVGAIVSVGMDLAMGNQSLLRAFIRCFYKGEFSGRCDQT